MPRTSFLNGTRSPTLIVGDLLILTVVPYVACAARGWLGGLDADALFERFAPSLAVTNGMSLLGLTMAGMHHPRHDYRTARRLVELAVALATPSVAAAVLFYASEQLFIGRGTLLLNGSLLLASCCLLRLVHSRLFYHQSVVRAAVLGVGPRARFIADYLASARPPDYELTGFIRAVEEPVEADVDERMLGHCRDLPKLVHEHALSLLIIADDRLDDEALRTVVRAAMFDVDVVDVLDCYEQLSGRVACDHIDPRWLLASFDGSGSRLYLRQIKPLADKLVAGAGLVAGLPVLAAAMAVIRWSSRGPLFHHQRRAGLNGRPFTLHKLRTMRVDAEADGVRQTDVDDRRIVRGGSWIRKLRVDEIPQFWNVLKGEMSVIGPRPERPEFIARYEQEIPFYRERLTVRPGITGWAQVNTSYASSTAETRRKLSYDLYYLKRVSPMLDMVIALRTLGVVFRARRGR